MFAFCNEQVIVFLHFEMRRYLCQLKKKTPCLYLHDMHTKVNHEIFTPTITL
jgi:hypothetical protein